MQHLNEYENALKFIIPKAQAVTATTQVALLDEIFSQSRTAFSAGFENRHFFLYFC